MANIGLPARTSEVLEASLKAWDTSVVADPSTLSWKVAVSSAFFDTSLGAPPLNDASWVSTELVDRSPSTTSQVWMLLIPLEAPPGKYGIWCRVDGAQYSSPVRWIGSVRLT